MNWRNRYFWMACLLVSIILGRMSIVYSEDSAIQTKQEDLYLKALTLKDNGEYDAAYEILKKLTAEAPNIGKYEISYVDILLDQSRTMKEAKDSVWKQKAKEAWYKIKMLYRANLNNADYYLIWAKCSWIAESKKESNIYKALEKAFHYKPNYFYAHIIKGDIYSGLAQNASPIEQATDTTALTGGSSTNTRHLLAMEAKSAYEAALSAADIGGIKKAYIYYKLGEIEERFLGNKEAANAIWKKALAISSDSRWGKLAKESMGK